MLHSLSTSLGLASTTMLLPTKRRRPVEDDPPPLPPSVGTSASTTAATSTFEAARSISAPPVDTTSSGALTAFTFGAAAAGAARHKPVDGDYSSRSTWWAEECLRCCGEWRQYQRANPAPRRPVSSANSLSSSRSDAAAAGSPRADAPRVPSATSPSLGKSKILSSHSGYSSVQLDPGFASTITTTSTNPSNSSIASGGSSIPSPSISSYASKATFSSSAGNEEGEGGDDTHRHVSQQQAPLAKKRGFTRAARLRQHKRRAALVEEGEGEGGEEEEEGSQSSCSSVVSVSSWDLEVDAHASSSEDSGSMSRRSSLHSLTAPQQLVRAKLMWAVLANHRVRYACGMRTGKGMHAYIHRDKGGHLGAQSPGQTHPYSLLRVANLCGLGQGDTLIDLGSGDGAAAITVAALTGCHVHGVENVHSRWEISVAVLRDVCRHLSGGRARGSSHSCCKEAETGASSHATRRGGGSSTGSSGGSSKGAGAGMGPVTGPGTIADAIRDLRGLPRRSSSSTSASSSASTSTSRRSASTSASSSLCSAPTTAGPTEQQLLGVHPRHLHLSGPAKTEFMFASIVRAIIDAHVTPLAPTHPTQPLCSLVDMRDADFLDSLRVVGSPLTTARVVFANNFGNRWGAFQEPVLRLLARVMPPGSILVSCTRFTSGRRGDGVLIDYPADCPVGRETLRKCALVFEVSGGWRGEPMTPTDDGYLFPRGQLQDAREDGEVESVWVRGRYTPQYSALQFMINMHRAYLQHWK